MFAIRLIPLSPFLHIERMQNAVGFRTFGALQAMLHTFLLRLSFWRVHVWCAVPPSRMTLSKTFHGLLQPYLRMFQMAFRIVDIVFECAYKWASYLSPKMPYCNANMAGGKILKGLQNRRIDERAMFLS
jgi:hypothetical protein